MRKRGDELVDLSPKLISLWWNLLNHAVFHSKLPPVAEVALVKHRNEYAWAHPRADGQVKLTIQPRFSNRRLFLMVLVHEMVHAWEHLHDRDMSHGEEFFKWRDKIKRTTNLDLEECPYDHHHLD